MCLEKTRLVENKETITCYKVAYRKVRPDQFNPPYFNFTYTLGEEAVAETSSIRNSYDKRGIKKGDFETIITVDELFNINSGVFHTYKKLDDAIDASIYLHSELEFNGHPCVLECEIPVKAIVYEGVTGFPFPAASYASTHLIPKCVVCNENGLMTTED